MDQGKSKALKKKIAEGIKRNDEWAKTPDGREYCMRLEFANSLALAMKSKRMTQTDLCAAIGMKQPQMSRIMAGNENVTLAMVLRLADGLGVHTSRLFRKSRCVRESGNDGLGHPNAAAGLEMALNEAIRG